MSDPGPTACRILARGDIIHRWRDQGPRHLRVHVVLVASPGDKRHVVVDSGHWWSAHEVDDEDIRTLTTLERDGQLHNACAVLRPAL